MDSLYCIPLISDLQMELLEEKESEFESSLSQTGLELTHSYSEEFSGNSIFFLIISGGVEQKFINILEKNNSIFNKKIFLIATNKNNSLPATLEIAAKLKQMNKFVSILYVNGPSDQTGLGKISDTVLSLLTKEKLNNKKIGLIGNPSDWLIASMPDLQTIKNKWGVDIQKIPINELKKKLKTEKREEKIKEVSNTVISDSSFIREPTKATVSDAAKVDLNLNELVKEYSLDALTIRCFDLLSSDKTTGCLALANLNDKGIISGCEGDLVSTLGMLWIYILTGKLSFMANPSKIDKDKNTISIAHCTVPISLTENYGLRTHYESGIGVGIQGKFAVNEEVTLFRLGGKNLNEIWCEEGKLLNNLNSENLCRTQIEIKLDNNEALDTLLNYPLGNHVLLVKGRVKSLIECYFSIFFNT